MLQSPAPQNYPIYPLFCPILPPQFHPPIYPTIPAQSYPLYNPVLRASYYPPPAVMAMNQHLIPSVQEEILEGNTTSPGTPPEGGCGDDGCENTPQAHATDMLTLVSPEQHMAPVAAESEPEPQPTSRLPPEIVGIEEPLSSRSIRPTWGEIMDLVDSVPSSPSTPTLLPWEENLDGEGSERSTSPSLTPLSWGEMMDDVDPIPSRPSTLLPWEENLDGEGSERSTSPSLTPLSWGEMMDDVDPIPSGPSTPTLLPWGKRLDSRHLFKVSVTPTLLPLEENLDGEVSEQYTSPSLTPLSWGEMMDDVDPIPSRPSTPTLLPWGKQLDEADAQLEGFKKDDGKVDNILEEKVKGLAVREQNRGTKLFEEPKEHTPEKPNKLLSSNSENTKGVQLYIRDLDHNVDSRRLFQEFLPFGNITKAKVVMENGRSKGFGFVTYQTMTEATTAIREMNGKMLGWKPLFVALSRSKKERQSCSGPREQKTRSGFLFKTWPSQNGDKQRVQTHSRPSITSTHHGWK